LFNSKINLIKNFINKLGLDVDKSNNYFETLLFYTCLNGNGAVVKCLVEQSENVNRKTIITYSYLCKTPLLNTFILCLFKWK